MPRAPLVSVIMTCFNTAPWLDAAIESVLRQSWSKLELIVVNDGSTDQCAEQVNTFAGIDRRVRPYHLARNSGTYPAKNIGMSISHGEVITFMDSDDVILPDRIEMQLDLLRSGNLVATTCNYSRVTQQGDPVLLGDGAWERQALISLMIKRRVIAEVGWFDPVRTSADDELFERIRHVYGRDSHRNVPIALYRALQREGSLSQGRGAPVILSAPSPEETLSAPRRAYVEAYRRWYAHLERQGRRPYMPFNFHGIRPFPVPAELALPSRWIVAAAGVD